MIAERKGRHGHALVADVGGTNARFALAKADGRISDAKTLKVADHPTFESALGGYLATLTDRPQSACFAVAGPVTRGRADFTNSPWTVDGAALAATFGFAQSLVVNDFEALSRFAIAPRPEDMVGIKPGHPVVGAPILVLGPGTGLGQAIAVPQMSGSVSIPTEGGHVTLPAQNEVERRLVTELSRMMGRRVAAEDVISGAGLVRLHRVRMMIAGRDLAADLTPADVTNGAMAGDADLRATIIQFCAFLGSVVGNAALSTGARGGVMLAGGIVPRIVPLLLESDFSQRFVGEGMMREYLEAIPVALVIAGDAALRGAAEILADRGG